MKPSKVIIAGAAVAGLLSGSAAVRANATTTSSHPGVSLQTMADEKSRYQNTCARDRMTARARAGARTGEKTTARAKEAAQPTEASLINSRSHYPRRHIGGPGAIQRGWDGPGVLSQ